MKPTKFVMKYYPYAREVERKTTIPALAILAQAAFESGWGKRSIGNNVFGIKYSGKGACQNVLTTEYDQNKQAYKGESVKSVEYIPALNKYKFKVYQKFADYDSPREAFLSHSKLLLSSRYKHALKWRYSPVRYLVALWRSGYATDPNYGKNIEGVVDSVKRRMPEEVREVVKILKEIKSIPTPRLVDDPPKKEENFKNL
jgi:flagellum-specific peptidoglycan hydrolase FlgJ